jgi:hypothetical protein
MLICELFIDHHFQIQLLLYHHATSFIYVSRMVIKKWAKVG